MRGKGIVPCVQRARCGITPAYAGKSCRFLHPAQGFWDHPRVCGEKRTYRCRSDRRPGSPPRMRGKVNGILIGRLCIGITPAYAGKRAPGTATTRRRRDHPRVCGEKTYTGPARCKAAGSPPRMRGKVQPVQLVHDALGITPAYAGKRGIRLAVDSKTIGSPPHVRGKECVNSARKLPVGITPACAGKRAILFRLLSLPRDHPRMCGEKTKKIP